MKKFSLQFLFSSITRIAHAVSVKVFFIVLMVCGFAMSGSAQVSIIQTSDGNICGQTAVTGSSPSCTLLPAFSIIETNVGDIAAGAHTLTISPPAGWQFCSAPLTATHSSASGSDITVGPAAAIVGSNLVLTFTAGSITNIDTISVSGLQVQPLTPTAPAGNLVLTAYAGPGISGTTVGTTSFGSLAIGSGLVTTYNVVGSGSYCVGGVGVNVSLTGSDFGVVYDLIYNGSSLIEALDGTGGALSFGAQTSGGTYTVVVNYGTPCAAVMTSSATVTVNPLPNSYVVGGGGSYCYGLGTCPDITLSGSSTGVNYLLYFNGGTLITSMGGTGSALDFGQHCAGGTYTVVAVNTTTGCSVTMAGSAVVTVLGDIGPITGIVTICHGSTSTLSDSVGGGTWSSSNTLVAKVGSITGVVTGVAAGSAIITYTIGSCSTTTVVDVPLGAGPTAFTGLSNMCLLDSERVTESVTGGYWSSSLVTVVDLGGGHAEVHGVNAGVGSVTYTSTAGCTVIETVTVNPLPVITTKDESICQGATTVLSADIGGGSWASSAELIAFIGSTTGVTTGLSPGSAIITYTLPTGCIDTTFITVLPLPAAIGGGTGVCLGQTTALTDTTSGGTWVSSNSGVGSISTTGVVGGVSIGSSIISYILPTGCLVTTTVYVNAPPSAITGPDSVCVGASVIETDAGGGTWASADTLVATVNSSTGLTTGVSAGNAIITFQAGSSCYVTRVFTVNPLPTPITPADDSLCVNGPALILSTGPGGGTWTSSNIAVATVDGTGAVTGVGKGTAIITYKLPTGCAAMDTVKVDPAPAAISGMTTICVNDTVMLIDTTGGGTWYSNNTLKATIARTSGDTAWVAGVAAGTAIISFVLPTGCLTICSVDVTPIPGPIMSTSSNLCQGDTLELSDSVLGGIWTSSMSSLVTVGSSTGIATSVGGTGSVVIFYSIGTCQVSKGITVNPLAQIVGPESICDAGGGFLTLTDTTSGGAAGWSSSSGDLALIGSTSNTATFIGTASGTSIVTYTNIDGCSAYDTITVNDPPVAVGPGALCQGICGLAVGSPGTGTWTTNNPLVTTLTVLGGGADKVCGGAPGTAILTYTLPTGCYSTVVVRVDTTPVITPLVPDTICAQTAQNFVVFPATGGTWSTSNTSIFQIDSTTGLGIGIDSGTVIISYTMHTGGCWDTTSIYVNPNTAIYGASPNVCVGSTVTFIDTTMGGVWSNDNTAVGSVDSAGDFTGIAVGTTVLSYLLPTGCLAMITVTVDPIPDSILNTIPVCVLQSVTLADSSGGGTWSSGNLTIAVINDSTGVLTGVAAGTVIVTYTLPTGCYIVGSDVVLPLPPPITGTFNVCVNDSAILYDDSAGYNWTSGDTVVGTISNLGVFQGISAGISIITYTNPATGCFVTAVETVHPLPVITVSQSPNRAICIGATDTLLASASVAGSYTWSPAYALSTTVFPFTVSSATVTTTYTVTVTSIPWGCISDTTVTVFVDSLLRHMKVVGRDSICVGTCDTLMASGRDLTYFSWKPVSGLSCTICDTVVACPDTTHTYIATAIDAYGCKDSVEFTVNVMPLPALRLLENPVIVCRGTPKQIFAFGAWSYIWSPPYFLSCDSCSNPVATDTFNMVYELTGATQFGCMDSIQVRVSVLDTNVNWAGDDTIICLGGSAQLNATSHSVIGNLDVPSYLWLPDSFLNSNNIPNPVATPIATTVYSVVITENGCFNDTIPVTVIVDSLPRLQITANPPVNTVLLAGTSVQLNTILLVDTAGSFEWKPATGLSCADCPNPTAVPSVSTTYTVFVVSNHGCVAEDTITINIACGSAEVFIPNTFTPNGDGVNDLFYVSSKGISTITRMSIYNRWGQLVFQANNIPPNTPSAGWDGTYKGMVVEPDVFDYVIDVVCELGSTYHYVGNVAIVR